MKKAIFSFTLATSSLTIYSSATATLLYVAHAAGLLAMTVQY